MGFGWKIKTYPRVCYSPKSYFFLMKKWCLGISWACMGGGRIQLLVRIYSPGPPVCRWVTSTHLRCSVTFCRRVTYLYPLVVLRYLLWAGDLPLPSCGALWPSVRGWRGDSRTLSAHCWGELLAENKTFVHTYYYLFIDIVNRVQETYRIYCKSKKE